VILLPQPTLHRRELQHVPRGGREVAEARRLMRHASAPRLDFAFSAHSLSR
jgi:hypothetical protein